MAERGREIRVKHRINSFSVKQVRAELVLTDLHGVEDGDWLYIHVDRDAREGGIVVKLYIPELARYVRERERRRKKRRKGRGAGHDVGDMASVFRM